MIPAIAIGLIWKNVYDPSSGLLNGILTGLGLGGFASYPWLGDPRTAMLCSMMAIIWGFVGFYMVLFIAAIKGIPAETYEAARIDGVGPANSTLVMSQRLVTTAFSKGQFGLACAMGVVLAAITLIFSGVVFLVNRLTGGTKDVSN